jgi:intracellular multiplication protein IcmL
MANIPALTAYLDRDNGFYRAYYPYFLISVIVLLVLFMCTSGVVLYQVTHRPIPSFKATNPAGQTMVLTPFTEPNLLPDTLLRWAGKAAVAAFTFDFVNYNDEFGAARSYFTDAGWSDFKIAVAPTLSTVIKNQLFVTGVVSGTPVIANQGALPGKGYVWRIQIPFLVTYQSANTTSTSSYVVILSIVRVPTTTNPQGIGIDQFVMANPYA